MGLTVKNLDDMARMVQETIDHHKKVFGTSLTKKDMKQTVEKALAEKRKKWLEGRVTDHSISELYTLLQAIDEHGKKGRSLKDVVGDE